MPHRLVAAPAVLGLVVVGALVLYGRAAAGARAAPTPGSRGEAAERAAALTAEAAALVRSGDIASARSRYRRATQIAPGDVEARFGYARTSGWLRDYDEAERAYRDGLARAPGSVEGLVGLADVLAWTGRHEEALEVLTRAARLAPASPDVARRQARVSRWRGDRPAALAAYRRTLELAPGDPEAERALVGLAAETTSALEIAYRRESLSDGKAARLGTDANTIVDARYAYTGLPRLALSGRLGYSDRFGDDDPDADDVLLGAGAAFRVRSRTTLRGEAAFGLDADTLPAFAGDLEVLQGVSAGQAGGVVLGLGYRHLRFNRSVRLDESGGVAGVDPNTTVHIVTPSVEWSAPWPVVLLVRYYYSVTEFERVPAIAGFPGLQGGTDRTSSILVKATFLPEARVVPFVAYARGVESFATAAQLRGFTTDTYAVGAELRVTPRLGVRLGYELQDSGRDTTGRSITQQNVDAGAYLRW